MEKINEQKYEEVSYQELARRVGDCVLNNEIHYHNDFIDDWELYNGEDERCIEHDTKEECEKFNFNDCEYEMYEIYQEYIITESGADYLKRNTNEIVFYSEKLNIYLWGITHFCTSWSGVFTKIKAY